MFVKANSLYNGFGVVCQYHLQNEWFKIVCLLTCRSLHACFYLSYGIVKTPPIRHFFWQRTCGDLYLLQDLRKTGGNLGEQKYTAHLKHPWQQEMDRDGNAGVLYERMSRALVLSSPARGNLAERQAVWGPLQNTAIVLVKDPKTSAQRIDLRFAPLLSRLLPTGVQWLEHCWHKPLLWWQMLPSRVWQIFHMHLRPENSEVGQPGCFFCAWIEWLWWINMASWFWDVAWVFVRLGQTWWNTETYKSGSHFELI